MQKALIDLYLNVKVRSTEEITNYNEDKLEEEREVLKEATPLLLVDYIRSSIEILMNMRAEEQALIKAQNVNESILSESSQKEPPKIYEEQIQKLEEESRSHIRVFLIKTLSFSWNNN